MSIEAKLAAWFGAVLLVLSILATVLGFQEVQFSSNSFEQVGTLVLTLILVALVIERAVEVYVSKRFDAEKLRVRRPLTRAEAWLAKAEKALAEERERRQGSSRPPTDEDQKYVNELAKDVLSAHTAADDANEQTWLDLSRLRASKVRSASVLSVVLGALASVSGVRVLGQFVPMQDGELIGALAESALQLDMFRITDTLMTALVLAGGADGIHKMVSRFRSFRSPV